MMFQTHLLSFAVLSIFIFQLTSCAVLENLFNDASSCGIECEHNISESSIEYRKACAEGCRLYKVIELAKDLRDSNKTAKLCEAACSEAFINESAAKYCNFGCNAYTVNKEDDEEYIPTLHVLTPLMYVKTAYNSMAHHVRQFISTSWTVYVQEDSGKMVVLQAKPQVVESVEYSISREDSNNLRDYQIGWQEAKLDWMDCISHQSGIPRWLLVVVLFGFIFTLLWLCCATAVTAPNQHLSSTKKKDMGYIVVCEPNNDIKAPLLPVPVIECNEEEAPPLPPKVSLI